MRKKVKVSKVIYGMGTLRAMRAKRNVIIQTRHELVKCKYCGETEAIIRYGYGKSSQPRYRCRRCGRTFMNNKASGRMQYPIEAVATALNLFYEGISLPKIQRQLKMTYGIGPQPSTIYYWIVRYSKKAARALNIVSIKTGSVWVADETVIKLKEKGGSKQWFWDIIDDETRFLLASHWSDSRTARDARILVERAASRADKIPKTITTDGWLVHYNFFRPHSALGGKTPAEVAGADITYKGWRDIIEKE